MITTQLYHSLPQDAKKIREAVFIKEQHFTLEFDEIDNIANHLVVYDNETPIACCRYFPDKQDNCYILGRLAVLKPYRGQHLGELLITTAEENIRSLHGKKISLSAQVRAQKFYEKQGFTASGDVYFDEYCEHIHMEKILK